jgi:hypothetical protein
VLQIKQDYLSTLLVLNYENNFRYSGIVYIFGKNQPGLDDTSCLSRDEIICSKLRGSMNLTTGIYYIYTRNELLRATKD